MSISTRKKMTARLGLIPLSVYFATPAGLYFGITSFINLPRIVIVFIMIVGLGWMLNILHLWIRNKITLEENVIEIRSYVAFPFFDSWSVLWHPQTSRNKTIQLSTIIGIIIVTTTPLVQLRKSVSEINWRDRVEIEFLNEKGNLDKAIVEIYIFPAFKKVLEEIIRVSPGINVSYAKLTGIQNVTQPNNPDYK